VPARDSASSSRLINGARSRCVPALHNIDIEIRSLQRGMIFLASSDCDPFDERDTRREHHPRKRERIHSVLPNVQLWFFFYG